MDKINFNNYTEPTLSANNLNQMQDNIEQAINNIREKSYIVATLESNYKLIKTGEYDKLNLIESDSEGTKLSIENGAIKIGAGVSKIKVNAMVHFQSVATSGLKWVTVYNNSRAVLVTNQTMSDRGSQCIPEIEIDVEEGDIISLQINSNSADTIRSTSSYTFLRVEVS